MSEYTKCPWLREGRTVYALNQDGFNRFSASVQDAHTSANELEANARRIVACVNACEGHPFRPWHDEAADAIAKAQGGAA